MQNPMIDELMLLASTYGREAEQLASKVLYRENFDIWTASAHANIHHYGHGGLLKHTHEVVMLCKQNNEFFHTIGKGVDPRLLFLAALFHDVGKLTDYEIVLNPVGFRSTTDKFKVYHVTRSAIEWTKAVAWLREIPHTFTQEDEDQVLHAILAHHGRLEWKSPVTPKDRTAWLLHLCDAMSARIDDVVKQPLNPYERM